LLHRLSPQERAAVVLKDAFDFRLEEIATILQTTVGTIKAALHGGREKLAAPSAKSRTYTYCGVTLQGNGEVLALSSQGTVEDIGNHKRRLRGVNHFSNGQIATVEAEGDLMARTLTGKIYE